MNLTNVQPSHLSDYTIQQAVIIVANKIERGHQNQAPWCGVGKGGSMNGEKAAISLTFQL